MKQAGAKIRLFKNKDAAFDCVLDRFFAGYEADFARIVKHGKRNPRRIMQEFFEYMEWKPLSSGRNLSTKCTYRASDGSMCSC